MRLLVVPLSLKETMVYCQRTSLPMARSKPRIDDRFAEKATKVWHNFQNSDTKWRKSVVNMINSALAKVSYDEWSLKTIPATSAVLRKTMSENDEKNEKMHVLPDQASEHKIDLEQLVVEYPSKLFTADQIQIRLRDLAEKGLSHHRKYMWLSAIGAPLTLPMAALPVIPNIPGFYLLYRAWSHWKALEGAKHLQYLVNDDHLKFEPNEILNAISDGQKPDFLLPEDKIDQISEDLGAKEMAPELHRAVHQVKSRVEESKDKGSGKEE